jgi:hypothetical protein
MLPRWYAWVGLIFGVAQLAAPLFIPIFLYLLWMLVTSLLLTLRPRPVTRPAIQ